MLNACLPFESIPLTAICEKATKLLSNHVSNIIRISLTDHVDYKDFDNSTETYEQVLPHTLIAPPKRQRIQ